MKPNQAIESRRHILTFVIEDYYQVGAFNAVIPRSHWHRFDSRLERNTRTLLDLLSETGNSATFFCCGWVADNHPELLDEVVSRGHEIACQTYFPTPIQEFDVDALRDDIARTRDAVAHAIAQEAIGFRVGRGWLRPADFWVLEQLVTEGFAYDSSICALGRQFVDKKETAVLHRHDTPAGEIWAIPVSSTRVAGLDVPIAGGNYIRQFPQSVSQRLIHRWIEQHEQPLVMYFHAWEIDQNQPSIDAAHWLQRIRHYRNLGDMQRRIRLFLEHYRFVSVARYLGLEPKAVDSAMPASITVPSGSDLVESNDARLDITVAIPCYNEEATLPYLNKTLDQFTRTFRDRYDVRFLFVDDGSHDKTWDKLNSFFGSRHDCKLVQHPGNKGIAAAILTAIENADTELVTIIDADCTFDPMQLPQLTALMQDDVDAVVASPLHPEGEMVNVPGWRLLMSKGAAFLYRLTLHHKFASYTSCFRVYRRSRVLPMRLFNHGFGGVTEILARMDLAGAKMTECPAVLESRLLGQSKINTLRTIGEHLRLVARVGRARLRGEPLPEPPGEGQGDHR